METSNWMNPWRYFEELDRLYKKEVTNGKVVFYGSSTFSHWVDMYDYIDVPIENHGFGGSTTDEGLYHYQKLVVDYKPRALVWYFGDNDFVCGYSVDEVEYVTRKTWFFIRTYFPEIPIIVIGTKVCEQREKYAPLVLELNKRIKDYVENTPNFYFIDTMDISKKDGKYAYENFEDDRLHFNKKGNQLLADKLNKLFKEIL